jgi:hypothetical protein
MLWSLWPNRRATVYSVGGRERLRLYWVARGIGWDFHSLVWERRASFLWRPYITISESDFTLLNRHQRWVNEMHSFDPTRGAAVLMIAEGDAPGDAPRCTINYSWRLWDLINNREMSRLQECENPFAPYHPSNERAA